MKTLEERFLTKLDPPDNNGCVNWTGALDRNGYGRVRLGGRDTPTGYAHRVAYEVFVGPIPDGLQIDHVKAAGCRSKRCCNPDHLEAVTPKVNTSRGNAGKGHLTRAEHWAARRAQGYGTMSL